MLLDYPLVGVEQEAYWVTGWVIDMPWIGLDQQGCGYLKHNCTAETVTDVQKFSYPINIMKEYPRVSLKLKTTNHFEIKLFIKKLEKLYLATYYILLRRPYVAIVKWPIPLPDSA